MWVMAWSWARTASATAWPHSSSSWTTSSTAVAWRSRSAADCERSAEATHAHAIIDGGYMVNLYSALPLVGWFVIWFFVSEREPITDRQRQPTTKSISDPPNDSFFFFCSCFFFLSLPIAISLPETKDERNAVSMRTDFLDFGQRNKESNKVHCRTRAIGPFHWTSQNKNKKQKTIEMDERLEFGKQMTNEKGVPRAQRAMNPWAWRRVASQRSLMST